jgi:hypothetical protein
MEPKEPVKPRSEFALRPQPPLLMVDIDGVVSLFGVPAPGPGEEAPQGRLHAIEGIPHFLSATAAAHLLELTELYELVWASGWEERADEHLPHLLGVPAGLPFLRLSHPSARAGRRTRGHWKIEAIDSFADGRPLAWVDDALDSACREWAAARPAPTLLVQTSPERGLTLAEAQELRAWAQELAAQRA